MRPLTGCALCVRSRLAVSCLHALTMMADGRAFRRGSVALILAGVCLLAGAGRSSGVSVGENASDQELDGAHKIHRFCAAASPRCAGAAPPAAKAKTVSAAVMARKAKPAASAEPGPAQARGARAASTGEARQRAGAPETAAAAKTPGAVDTAHRAEGMPEAARASGRWGGPLTRLRRRLAELESKLHKTVTQNKAYRDGAAKQMVRRLGRRLLASADEEARAFPDSFYHSFGGLPQLAGVSASVLRGVEDQICSIYTAMCSSLASMAALDGAPVPLDTERSLWYNFSKLLYILTFIY